MGKINTQFGQNLKKIRSEKGFTQSDLAEKLNVSDRTISSWEQGRTEPSIAMIEVLCLTLNCSKSQLLGEQQHKIKPIDPSSLFCQTPYDKIEENNIYNEVANILLRLNKEQLRKAKNILDLIVNGDI